MPKLSTGINLKFVQLYREEECLWNATIPSHKDKCMLDSSLKNICVKLLTMGAEITTKEIKAKIKNLTATYCQELSKIEKSTRSGAGSTEEYKSKLNWFEEMHSFIKNVPMKRKTADSQESAINKQQENSETHIKSCIDDGEDVQNPENFSSQPSTSSSANMMQPAVKTSTSANKSQGKVPATPAPKKRKIAQVATLVDELRLIKDDLKSTPACEPQQNEHDIFGSYVASQLKMLSTARAIKTRDEINAMLSRSRMEDLINDGNTIFSYQSPSQNSSDSHTTNNTLSMPLRSGASNLATTEYQANYQHQNPSSQNLDEITFHFPRQDIENPIAAAFINA